MPNCVIVCFSPQKHVSDNILLFTVIWLVSLFSLSFFRQRSQSPVELGDNPYLSTSVYLYVSMSILLAGPQIPLAGPQALWAGPSNPLAGQETSLNGP